MNKSNDKNVEITLEYIYGLIQIIILYIYTVKYKM
jgi:hypothetical protein